MNRESSDTEETSRKQGVEDPDDRSGQEYEQFVDFFENSPVPMHWVGPDGTVVRANQAELDALGYSREEYVGSHIADFHADQDVIDDILDRLHSDEELSDYEARMERKDGSIRHVLIDSCVNWEDGEFVNTRCVTRDITERKKRDRELEEIYGRISDAFFALDEDWEFTHLNEQAHDVINPDGRELEGKHIWDEFPAATERKFKPKYERAMYEQETVSFEEYYPDPLDAWFEVRAYPSETGLSAYFRDITDRKEHERQLRESEQRFRTLAESFPNGGVFYFDEDLRFQYVSGSGFDPIDTSPEDFVGNTLYETDPLTEEDIELLEPLMRMTLEDDRDTIEIPYEDHVYEVHSVPLRDGAGAVTGGFFITQDVTGRKERQQELAEERAFIEQTLDALDDVFYVLDADGVLTRWNEHVNDLTGYSDTELTDMDMLEFFPEDEQPRVTDSMERTIETGSSTVRADVLTADGQRVPYEFSRQRLTDPQGELLGVVRVGRDLTDRKEREAELAFVRDLLEKTEQVADVGGWEIETETGEVFWTEHLFELLGVDDEEAPPLEEALEVYIEEDRPRVANAVEEAVAAGESFSVEARFQRPDGEIRWLQVQGEPVTENGEVITVRGAVQDITERKHREEQLTDREQALRSAYKIIADNDRSVSEQLDDLLAVARDHLGTDYATFSHIHDDRYEFERVAVAPGIDLEAGHTTDRIELPICERVLQTGEPLVLSDVAAEAPELVDPEWGIACYLGAPVVVNGTSYGTFCFYDVEPRSEAFSEWEQTFVELLGDWVGSALTRMQTTDQVQRQNEQLEEFANVVSHDLRNPLNVAEGRLELAQDECDSEHLNEIEKAHTRMETLIEDLLTLAREGHEVTEYTSLNLSALIDNCWATVETRDSTLVNDIDSTVQADRSRLKQLFENLNRNAVEHGGDGVTVTVGKLENGFYIEDDGPGIPQAEREDVFKPGFSTNTDGTGFGLSIVKQVAEAHNWGVQLSESENGGARFEITGVEFADS